MRDSEWLAVEGNSAEIYERLLVPAISAEWAPKMVAAGGVGAGDRVLDVACARAAVRFASRCMGTSQPPRRAECHEAVRFGEAGCRCMALIESAAVPFEAALTTQSDAEPPGRSDQSVRPRV